MGERIEILGKQTNERKTTMKKMMVAAVAAFALGAFAQDSEQEVNSQSWRLTVGGFGRGSMSLHPTDMPKERFEAYGADADVLFKAYETEQFNFWTGIGFGWAPNRRVYNETTHQSLGGGLITIDDTVKSDFQYGELRLMAVPEWKATDDFMLGLRLGVAFDWTRCKSRWENVVGSPFGTAVAGGSETYSDFLAQGIVGLQGTYMFMENVGLYAAFDWRGGSDPTFRKNGDNCGKLSMDGWYASAGVVVGF